MIPQISLGAILETYINQVYLALLERLADPAGLQNAINSYVAGSVPIQQIVYDIAMSTEARAVNGAGDFDLSTTEGYVAYMYRAVLGREPDREGFDYWVNDIDNNGWPKEFLAINFIGSEEYRTITQPRETRGVDNDDVNVVILDAFQSVEDGYHGPNVIQNFYEQFNETWNANVFAKDLDGSGLTLYRRLQEIDDQYAPDVINMSFIYGTVVPGRYIGDLEIQFPRLPGDWFWRSHETYQEMWERGISLVVAAGNSQLDEVGFVNAVSSVFNISVGALDGETLNIADYSNVGGDEIDFYANGLDAYGEGQGTSYAAPRVTAWVAQIYQTYEGEGVTMAQIRTILEQNATRFLDSRTDYAQQAIFDLTDFSKGIETFHRVESIFELFGQREGTQQELQQFINDIESGTSTLLDVAQQVASTTTKVAGSAAIMEMLAAPFHFFLGREAEDVELISAYDTLDRLTPLDQYGATVEQVNRYFDWFVDKYNVDTTYSFVDNNWQVLDDGVLIA